jgi:hypothetical protein
METPLRWMLNNDDEIGNAYDTNAIYYPPSKKHTLYEDEEVEIINDGPIVVQLVHPPSGRLMALGEYIYIF